MKVLYAYDKKEQKEISIYKQLTKCFEILRTHYLLGIKHVL